jgi:hypothetical protein
MAYATQKIGPHEFAALRGNWKPPAEKLRVDARPGVDGVEVTKEGKRGEPFTLVSVVDCEDYKDAQDTYDDYLELTEADPVPVTLGNESSTARDFLCQVIDVQQMRAAKTANVIGNTQSEAGGAILVCRWTLFSIAE